MAGLQPCNGKGDPLPTDGRRGGRTQRSRSLIARHYRARQGRQVSSNEEEMLTIEEKRNRFRTLHGSGCFVMPSPWDIGTARMMQQLGFTAIATTSAGLAWSIGRPQYEITFDDVIEHLASLCEKVDVPVCADFESGFAKDPDGVAINVDVVVDTGIAGFSIEDRDADADRAIFEMRLAT